MQQQDSGFQTEGNMELFLWINKIKKLFDKCIPPFDGFSNAHEGVAELFGLPPNPLLFEPLHANVPRCTMKFLLNTNKWYHIFGRVKDVNVPVDRFWCSCLLESTLKVNICLLCLKVIGIDLMVLNSSLQQRGDTSNSVLLDKTAAVRCWSG